ncbi:MAG: DUF3795 domain-containing protein [Promethearchaeota archaeon]
MIDTKLNPCGHYCDKCPSYLGTGEPSCPGCMESNGTPWWGSCKVFNCSIKKDISHCGMCGQFPCDQLASHYDPDNPQGQRNAVIRLGILAYRTKHGDEKAIELAKKLMAL